jgi:hypothetical protein
MFLRCFSFSRSCLGFSSSSRSSRFPKSSTACESFHQLCWTLAWLFRQNCERIAKVNCWEWAVPHGQSPVRSWVTQLLTSLVSVGSHFDLIYDNIGRDIPFRLFCDISGKTNQRWPFCPRNPIRTESATHLQDAPNCAICLKFHQHSVPDESKMRKMDHNSGEKGVIEFHNSLTIGDVLVCASSYCRLEFASEGAVFGPFWFLVDRCSERYETRQVSSFPTKVQNDHWLWKVQDRIDDISFASIYDKEVTVPKQIKQQHWLLITLFHVRLTVSGPLSPHR